jgi:hypothetical protein
MLWKPFFVKPRVPAKPDGLSHQASSGRLELHAEGLAGLADAVATAAAKRNAGTSGLGGLLGEGRLLTASDVVWEQLYRLPAMQVLRARRLTGLAVPLSRFLPKPAVVAGPHSYGC